MRKYLHEDSKLFLFCGGYPTATEWHFYPQGGSLKVENSNQLIAALLPLCDGSRCYSEIKKILVAENHETAVSNLVQYLFDNCILVERERLYEAFMNYLYAGSPFERDITQEQIAQITAETSLPPITGTQFSLKKVPSFTLGALAATRRTTYKFGSKPLAFNQICALFWCMYGLQGHYDERLSNKKYTIPSGGSMYALRLDIFILQDTDTLKKGHYLWRPEICGFELISSEYIFEIKQKLFNPKIDLNQATGAFVISADLNRTSRKYSNAALPLSYIEAGHAFQNGYLFASQENIGIAEIFGFRRRLIESIISDNSYSYYSLTCGVFGSRPED